jgi:hypothetical protein
MNLSPKKLLSIGAIPLLTASLLVGCAAKPKPAPAKKALIEQAAEEETAPVHAQSLVLTAWVQAINPSKHTLTLKLPDGKTARVNCGPEVQGCSQVQASDDVRVEFREAVDLVVVNADEEAAQPTPTGKRGRKADKPKRAGGGLVKPLELAATVAAIDLDRRRVTFREPKGSTTTVGVAPEVKGLDAVQPGDAVLARYLDVASVRVTTPEKLPVRRR